MSKIMAVNAGSSSLKFQLFEMPAEQVLLAGTIERIGMEDAIVTLKFDGKKKTRILPIANHTEAVQILLKSLIDEKILGSLAEIDGVGHRVVHGGEEFASSVVITDKVAKTIADLSDLAPLHNPANLTGYKAFKEALPTVGHVAVFDTAFHQTMAPDRYIYPIPYEYYEDYKVRRYGFHGTSHMYVSRRCIELLGKPAHSRIITCHIGNGASLAAVKDGKCVDTSMGFTPLAGVMMGTRSGDIDPAIVTFLAEKLGKSAEDVVNILNKKSGLLGVSGISADSRDINAAMEEGNKRATLAREIQVNTVCNFIGSYYIELGGCDAIVFTAGLGENDVNFRKMILDKIAPTMGINIDEKKNNVHGEETLISTPDSKVKVYIIPTNEEIMIARDTVRLLNIH
ncbi:MAG: acetate kinase [Bacilli bacterium]|nr:acetate kinase [Bacilli bacterium]